ncbi:acyl carrier protein [Myxococcus sp. Y35]|uniref:acyl carrier protein n=1 Tax=Pseudomyxococcus flavus TaxID=3115648 RepID=UPI003CF0C5F8
MAERELEVINEIHRIVTDELEWKGAVEPTQDLVRDLQLDSLGLTVLAVGLENRFRIRLSEEDAQGVRTVGDLAKLVARRIAEPPASVPEVGP